MVTRIRQLVEDAGACAVGVLGCGAVAEAEAARLHGWLAQGCHATMDYLARNEHLSLDPRLLLEGAQTIVCAAFAYAPADERDRSPLIADYARGADYHKVLRKRLKPVCRWLEAAVEGSRTRICVDSAPVRERYWAVAAGLGHIGLHGQLIVPGVGSKVFLAEILWTGAVASEAYAAPPAAAVACLQCGVCMQACPAGALRGDGSVDARRCLSFKTIESREPDPDLVLPGRVYGCDICQDVCPENRVPGRPLADFRLREPLRTLTRADLAALTPAAYDALTLGTPLRRAPLEVLKQNAGV